MRYALNHSVEKSNLDNHRGCHLDNLEWHDVTAVSAHPWGLSHQWQMSSSLFASWSLQSCLGATCVRSVFHIFFISQRVKAQSNHTWCKSGPKHSLFHLQLFWLKLSHLFWRVTFCWMVNGYWDKCSAKRLSAGQPWTLLSLLPIIIPYSMYISQVPANGLCIITIYWTL